MTHKSEFTPIECTLEPEEIDLIIKNIKKNYKKIKLDDYRLVVRIIYHITNLYFYLYEGEEYDE